MLEKRFVQFRQFIVLFRLDNMGIYPKRNNSLTNSSTPQVKTKPKTDIANDAVSMLRLFSVNLFMAVNPL